ncbi:MAG: CoA transferase [Gammaproteobacteria bacterium]|nr:CoA transferase [Gammaproteobacteria bacterium]
MPDQPLSGLKIIDLTRVLSGPFCTMLLGDLGADVIKVEAPEGDTVRGQGAGREGLSWYFAAFNRNKRSVVLNLKDEADKAILTGLLKDADVLVENYRPGVMARLGFDEEQLQLIRPGLITCSINGFGSDGPYKARPAFDFIAQAMSGFMSTNGRPDDPPLRTGLPISDLVAGIYGALAVTAALLGRERGSEKIVKAGEHIDVSLTNSMISLLAFLASNYFATGELPVRTGNDHPIAAPYGLFRTADHDIAVAPNDNVFFGRLMDALDLSDTKADPDFATPELRVKNRSQLNRLVESRLVTESSDHWVAHLNDCGVPCGPVHTLDRVFSDPQVIQQEMMIDVPHPGHGTVKLLGFPMKFKNRPCQVRHPAPDLGEYNEELR